MKMRDFFSTKDRREALEAELKISLKHMGKFSISESIASNRNCENMIGVVQVPVGIAGPIRIKDKEYYLPLATTEGALVASVGRGCKAIIQSGGVTVISKKIGMTRAPVFEVASILEGQKLIKFAKERFIEIKKVAESTSSHLTLLEIKSWMSGRNVFLRFSFDTQDAMGMNMVTIAIAKIVEHIEKEASFKCVALSGNMCVDKKPNWLNFIEGRGYSVWADILISPEVVETVFKTNIKKIINVAKRKLMYGSIMSGSIGFNAHYANILAALFLATGQDIAHVAECSIGITEIDEVDGKLYASVFLPDLVVGTVGGGTILETQKEALSILGLDNNNDGQNGQRLAEIIGGAVLAGELSLLAALSSNDLAKAHQVLARGK